MAAPQDARILGLVHFHEKIKEELEGVLFDFDRELERIPYVDFYAATSWQVGDVKNFMRRMCLTFGFLQSEIIKTLRTRVDLNLDPEIVRLVTVEAFDDHIGGELETCARDLAEQEEEENPSVDPNREHRLGPHNTL